MFFRMVQKGLSRSRFVVVALLVLLGGCAEEGKDTYTSLWDDYFSSCATNCHEPGGANGLGDGPDMSSKDAFYFNLVSKTSNDYPNWLKTSDCDGYSFIDPSNAAGSLLPAALIESESDAFSASHAGCTTAYSTHVNAQIHVISDDRKKNIIDWINNGAQDN